MGESPAVTDDTDSAAGRTMRGPYLGQEPPGFEPKVFAPGIVSTGGAERDMAMMPDGSEMYFTSVLGGGFVFSAIVVVRRQEGTWSDPEVASFSGRYLDLEPAISPDGSEFFFVSRRPRPGSPEIPEDEDIWVMQRAGDGWGEPVPVEGPVNSTAAEFFPSITSDGTLYFTRRGEDRTEAIYRSRRLSGRYREPERLGPSVNASPTQFNAYIAPDESYLILCSWGREDSLGGVDYYIVFRSPQDEWSGPFNLGPVINSPEGQEWSPYVSPDGEYFFFMSSRSPLRDRSSAEPLSYPEITNWHRQPMNGNSDIWWVDASILTEPPQSPIGAGAETEQS